MKSLLRFIIRNHYFILFIIYVFISLFFIYQFNNYHKSYFINFVHAIHGRFGNTSEKIDNYLSLRDENTQLLLENKRLRNLLNESWNYNGFEETIINDSLFKQKYHYIEARVINNSVNRKHNYITIDKGTIHGIESDMAVISDDGVVGVVLESSENFSTILPVLNLNYKISAKIKKNNYYGSISWNGRRTDQVNLNQILHHVQLEKGDTVVTTGYSHIYPEGVMIGTINNFRVRGNFYEINLKLSTDFSQLSNVYVINNLYRDEQVQIEEVTEND